MPPAADPLSPSPRRPLLPPALRAPHALPAVLAPLASPIPALPALLALVAFAALALPAISRAQQSTLFGPRLDFAAGSQPWAVATGDLNGDGRPDVVCANANASTISVCLGDGAGGLGPKTDYAVGGDPVSVAIGDLNNDGRPDVVVDNFTSNFVSVFLGNGSGGFAPRLDVPAVYNLSAVVLADLNGDGKLDFAFSSPGAGAIVALGNGAGGFGPRTSYATGVNAYSIAAGDLDNDGKVDLAVGNYLSSTVTVLRGNGDGTFALKGSYAVGSGVYAVAIGDLNNDGKPDVAVANSGTLSSSIGVLMGDGTGALGAMTSYTVGSDARPQGVVITDLNGDGKPDLAAALPHYTSLAFLLGDGTGNFGAPTYLTTPNAPIALSAADLNGDGQPDLVAADNGSDSVSVFLNVANGGFSAAASYGALSFPFGVAIGDLTGDGKADVVVGYDGGGNLISTLIGNGAGALGPHTDFIAGTNPYAAAIGDLNGDGKADLITANHDANTVSVLLGSGVGGFGTQTIFATGSGPWAAVTADFNGDGKLDVATVNSGASSVSVLLGNGAGALGAATNYPVGTAPVEFAVADFNGDGRPDLVVANETSNSVSVLLNNGAGGFNPKVDYTVMNAPISVAVGDLNNDGKPDIVSLTSGYPWGVSVLLGNGSGGFGARTDFGNVNGAYPWTVAVADVNGDHRPDVVIAATYYSTLDVLYGNGAGSLMGRSSLQCPTGLIGLATGDLNGDGRPDLVASTSSAVSVLTALKGTRTALTVSSGSALIGSALTLTASVTALSPASPAPGGTMSFFDGSTLLGTSPVNAGVAALALFAPRLGNRTINAVYNGDGKYQRSLSPARNLRVVSSAAAALAGITDIANDQGGQVRVQFLASAYDYVGSPTPIAQYEIYRQVPGFGLASAAIARARAASLRAAPSSRPMSIQVDGWDYVGSVAAHGESGYDLVAPTLADSNGSGIHRNVYFVRAATATPTLYYDSPPDSGYSVDNLAPGTPAPFTGAYASGAMHLHWGANLEPDLWYYRVYRGSTSGFVPGAGSLIATRSDTNYVDTGNAGFYYKLSAVDVNGNESRFALVAPSGTTDVPGGDALALALEGARPNPIRGPGLDIHFTLPSSEPARLELMDVSGRRLVSRDVGDLGPGPHVVDLAQRRQMPAGLYLVRLTRGETALDTRVVVLP